MCDIGVEGRDLYDLRMVSIVCRPSAKIDCREQIGKVAEKIKKEFPSLKADKYSTDVDGENEKLHWFGFFSSTPIQIPGPMNPIKVLVEKLGLKYDESSHCILGGSAGGRAVSFYENCMKNGPDLMVDWHFMLGEECKDKSGWHPDKASSWHPYAWFFPIVPVSIDVPR